MNEILEAAIRYTLAGLRVIPILGDGSKEPALPAWREYQERLARRDELEAWFSGRDDCGVAVVGGKGLEILDIESLDLFQEYEARVNKRAPGLIDRLPQVQTPRPGAHLYWYCEAAGPSQKLAKDKGGETLIETRGKGGYALAPPSPPSCHPTHRPYAYFPGPDLTCIPRITPGEREILLDVARSFDERPEKPEQKETARPDLLPTDERLRRGEEYVRKWAPLARSGHGGHDTTYAVARYLINDLGLGEEETRRLMNVYNERLGAEGEEMWTGRELDHKVASAAAAGEHPDYQRGCAAS